MGFVAVGGGSFWWCKKGEREKREKLKMMMEAQGIKEDALK
jgi:hypothetical protein